MLVTSRLAGGLSNRLVVFPFHDRFWTLLVSFLQEACLHCWGQSGVLWRRRRSSSTPDRSWRGCVTCMRTRSSTETSRYWHPHTLWPTQSSDPSTGTISGYSNVWMKIFVVFWDHFRFKWTVDGSTEGPDASLRSFVKYLLDLKDITSRYCSSAVDSFF